MFAPPRTEATVVATSAPVYDPTEYYTVNPAPVYPRAITIQQAIRIAREQCLEQPNAAGCIQQRDLDEDTTALIERGCVELQRIQGRGKKAAQDVAACIKTVGSMEEQYIDTVNRDSHIEH